MKLKLRRDDCGAACTLGRLYVDGVYECETLEDVDRRVETGGHKLPGRTAIPRGVYRVELTHSSRFGRVLPLLVDVPGYEGVRIHPGNTAADTEGCILVGQGSGANCITSSRRAFDRLFAKLQPADEITLEVV